MSPITETLARDHRALEQLITELGTTPSREPQRRVELYGTVQSLLVAHARAEEVAVYRPLRRMLPDEVKALEAYEEHHLADLLLQELGSDCPGGRGWGAKARVLEEIVRHHIKEEELQLFALIDQAFDVEAQMRMTAEFTAIKHQNVERALAPLRRATPAFLGRAIVSVQARAGRGARAGELFLRRRLRALRPDAPPELAARR